MAHELKRQISPEKEPTSWDPEKVLADALAERALFLESNPQYRSFQREIDMILDKAGTSENRMNVLSMLMEAKLLELHEQFRHLNAILTKAAS